jgi:hypothetical protein
MKSKDQQLLEEAYAKVQEAFNSTDPNITDLVDYVRHTIRAWNPDERDPHSIAETIYNACKEFGVAPQRALEVFTNIKGFRNAMPALQQLLSRKRSIDRNALKAVRDHEDDQRDFTISV